MSDVEYVAANDMRPGDVFADGYGYICTVVEVIHHQPRDVNTGIKSVILILVEGSPWVIDADAKFTMLARVK